MRSVLYSQIVLHARLVRAGHAYDFSSSYWMSNAVALGSCNVRVYRKRFIHYGWPAPCVGTFPDDPDPLFKLSSSHFSDFSLLRNFTDLPLAPMLCVGTSIVILRIGQGFFAGVMKKASIGGAIIEMNTINKRYEIRVAEDKDVPDLTKMLFSLRAHMFRSNNLLWKYSVNRRAEQSKFYQKMIRNPDILLLTVFDSVSASNVGLGFGWIIKNEQYDISKFGQIGDIWIEPTHRRKGLCKELVSQIISFFSLSGVESLSLEYSQGNFEAEKVWKNLGFKNTLITAHANLSEIKRKL
ncbi:GCN5-related N-acetyltransferase domain protein [Desulfosarcina variabilis str. Montpellier]